MKEINDKDLENAAGGNKMLFDIFHYKCDKYEPEFMYYSDWPEKMQTCVVCKYHKKIDGFDFCTAE